MNQVQNELKSALQAYFELGDETLLEKLVAGNANIGTDVSEEYPDGHRIADIRVGDSCFRIGRISSQNDLLSIKPIDSSEFSEEPGVPFWLAGESLRQWVKDEEDEPSQGPIDWSRYQPNNP